MNILIFPTEQEAINAVGIIDSNASYPIVNSNWLTREEDSSAQMTTTWCSVKECKKGGYFIPKPKDDWMISVSGFVEEEFDRLEHLILPEEY